MEQTLRTRRCARQVVLDPRDGGGGAALARRSSTEAHGAEPRHRPPAGGRARGPRHAASPRRRALRARAAPGGARPCRGRAVPARRRRHGRRWPRCATRRASRCSCTCATATRGCASPRSSRPTGCARSSPVGAALPMDVGSAGRVLSGEHSRAGLGGQTVGEREPGVASVSAPVCDRRSDPRRGQRLGADRAPRSRRPAAQHGEAVRGRGREQITAAYGA